MLTKEQKIEQLLYDLDAIVYEVGYSEPGLPIATKSGMKDMKTLVKAFVDSLEEGKPTGFDENKQNAYRAFLEAGIPDEWANAMADRFGGGVPEDSEDAWECLMSFALWEATSEGFRFWNDVATEVGKEGVSAFSKFQCPK
jgi:hypothetical protein